MNIQAKLEKPEIFDDFWAPYFSRRQRRAISKAAEQVTEDLSYQPNIAVIVRTKNDKVGLGIWVKHIEAERKGYRGRIDLIVVDTESTDGTLAVAKKFQATIVPIKQAKFNYPKSINMGFEKVKSDVVAAFITVGHAYPVVNIGLMAAARHFKNPKVAAVYADQIPHSNATSVEKTLFYITSRIHTRLKRGTFNVVRMHGGLTGGTGCMIRMSVWREHKFDEAYGHGGEDLAWGRWALRTNHTLIYDPLTAVHHSHGLGFINLMRQLKYWGYISLKKGEFKTDKVHRYRPDLRSK